MSKATIETCLVCGRTGVKIIDSRPTEGGRRRRKMCPTCGIRWNTFEYAEVSAEAIHRHVVFAAMYDG